MQHSPGWWRALVLSAVVLCIAFAMSASGQNKGTAGFANVDFQKIQNDYKAKAVVESDLKNMQQKLDGQLQRRDQMPFLTEEEQKQLDALYEKDARTDDDNKKIKDLEAKGTQLSSEIQALRNKPEKDLTDADKKRIKDAEDSFVKAQQTYTALKDQRDNTLKQYINTNSDKLMRDIRAAIAKVAEQKGYSIVFNSEVAPYAGADITAPVLAELNKK